MVEIEEITANSATKAETTASGSSSSKTVTIDGKTYRKLIPKKDMPSISHMLAHGSPEAQARSAKGVPKTFCEVFGYPVFLAICFAISLLIFHYAPHDKSVQPRGKFSVPKRQQQQYRPVVQENSKVPPLSEEKVADAIQQDKADEPGNDVGSGEL